MDYWSGKKLLPRQVTGAAMAVAGVGFLEFGGGASLALSSGDLASLLQPLAFGVAFWRMETVMRKYPEEALRSTGGQLLAVFITSSIYCLSTCTIDLQQIQGWLMQPMILGALFFTGLITTALTIYMEAVALKTLTAAETTLILSTEPLWGAAFASFLIGEQFGMDAAMGAALIVAGCIFSNLGWDGMLEMVGGKKKALEEMEEIVEEEQPFNIETAEKAILEVGMIGMLARLVALLEMGDFAIGAASVVAAEEIVEEVITHVGDLPL
jgi:drug/metabolite transporter (DMT)-like permease